MKPTTIRLPAEVLEKLDREAQEHGFHTRTEYLRYLIDNRELVVSIALEERKDRLEALSQQVEELESRLVELEEQPAAEPVLPPQLVEMAEDEQVEGQLAAAISQGGAVMADEPAETSEIDLSDEETEPLELEDPGPENIESRTQRLEFFAPTQEVREDRETAVANAWEALAEAGELTRVDFERSVYPDNPATFTTFDGWYDRLLVPAFDQLQDVEAVDENTWRYVGE